MKYLEQAVDSLLRQIPAPYEIVIVDDASGEGTRALCARLRGLNNGTRFIVDTAHAPIGAQAARNRGLDLATGDCVLFLDDDDVIAEGGIAPLISELEKDPSLSYVYGQVIKADAELEPIKRFGPIGSKFSSSARDIAGYHWSVMAAIYRRDYLKKVGSWNESLTGSQDWEYQARVKMAGGKGKYIEHVVACWRDHSGPRVGTKAFRRDYTYSVIRACLSIYDRAVSAGLADQALERRLAMKMLIHSAELSVNGCGSDRRNNMGYIAGVLHHNSFLKYMIILWAQLPVYLDGLILWILKIRSRDDKK